MPTRKKSLKAEQTDKRDLAIFSELSQHRRDVLAAEIFIRGCVGSLTEVAKFDDTEQVERVMATRFQKLAKFARIAALNFVA